MFEFKGIDHVQLAGPAGCEEEARAFFSGILGLEEIVKPASLNQNGCWFRCGNQEIHIGIQIDFSPSKKAHPGLQVTGLKELARALAENGVEVREDKPIAGRNRVFVDDPFGNRIEFLEFIRE
ncbi:VOC family protein [Peribacillus sp. SCS-37]|uniref:VOC family protein n=1 Tax=Paraperibacillus esterisolvens TaxID=3115296 RepID=UPI00390608BB